MAGDDRQQMLAEAYRRNLLPPDMKSAYEEAQKRGIVDKMPSSEPDFGTNFLGGLTAPVRGAGQILEQVGIGAKTKQQTSEGVQKTDKVKSPDADPNSFGYALGSMVGPAGVANVEARAAPRIITPMTKAMAAGVTGAALQPVTDEEHFWREKTKQAEEGMVLGYGFSVGGKIASAGVDALGKWLARSMPENVENRAVQAIIQRIQQGHKYGAPSAQDMLDLMAASDKSLVLADMNSPNLKSLAGRVTRSGGDAQAQARTFLNQRDAGAPGRLNSDIDKYIFSGPTMHQTAQGLLTARSAAGRPAYEALDSLQSIWSPRLQQFIENPDVAKGMARGYHIERNMALADNRPFDPTMMGVDLDEQGNIHLLRTPSMRVLDMGKQGLDAMIAENRDPITGRLNSMGLSLERVRQAYIKELDSLDKDGIYKKARNVWAGPSASLDAMRFGRSVFDDSPEVNAANFARLGEGDQEFARIGMADVMRERLMKSRFNSDESKAVLNSPWMAAQMKPFFKSKGDYDRFVQSVTEERMMAESKQQHTGGSQTAERTAEDKSPIMGAAKLFKSAIEGRFFASLRDMWQLSRDLKAKPDPALDSAIAKYLFTPNIHNTPMGQRLMSPLPPAVQHYLSGKTAPAIQDVVAPTMAGAGGAALTEGQVPASAQPPSQETPDGTRQAAQ